MLSDLIYALKIPEFRQSLITLCSRRRVVDGMDRKSQEGQDTVAIDLIEPRTLPTDPSYTQQNFEHESMDTKLHQIVITQNCKKGLPFPTHHPIKQTVNELRDVVVASNIALTGIFGSPPPPPPPLLSSLGLVNKIHLLVMFVFWICIFTPSHR